MRMRWFIGPVLALLSVAAQAQTVGVELSDTTAHFRYGMLVGGGQLGRSEVTAGFLYNTDESLLAELGLQVVDEAGTRAPGLEAGVGGKIIAARTSSPDHEMAGLALSAQLRYLIPPLERVAIGLEGAYAPDIVTVLDFNSFWELAARLEYEVLPTAAAYVGYRRFAGELSSGGTIEVDDSFRLGLRLRF